MVVPKCLQIWEWKNNFYIKLINEFFRATGAYPDWTGGFLQEATEQSYMYSYNRPAEGAESIAGAIVPGTSQWLVKMSLKLLF